LKNNLKNTWLGLIGGLIVGLIVGWLLFGAISTEGQASRGIQSQASAYAIFENIESKTIDGVDYLGGKLVSGVNFRVDGVKMNKVYLIEDNFSTEINYIISEYNNNSGQAFKKRSGGSNNSVKMCGLTTVIGNEWMSCDHSCGDSCTSDGCSCSNITV